MPSGGSERGAAPRWLPASLERCSERNLLAIVTLAALAIRLYLTFTSYCISGDGVAYVGIARNLAAGNTAKALASVFPPLYPWLISIVHHVVPDWEIAGQLISSLLGAAAVVPVYYLVREVFGRRDLAAGAAILTAIHPDLSQYSASVRTEAGYITMIVTAVLLMLMAIRRRRLWWFAGAGLLCGIAYWYRTEAIGMPVVSAGFLILGALIWREWNLGWAIAAASCLVAAFLIVAAPFLIYLNSTSDHFIVSRELKAAVMYGMGDVSKDKTTWQLRGYSPHTSIWAPLQVAPGRYLGKIGGDLLMSPYFYAEALGPMLTLFLVVGLVNRGASIVRNYREALPALVTLFYVVGFAASYTGPAFPVASDTVRVRMGDDRNRSCIGMDRCARLTRRADPAEQVRRTGGDRVAAADAAANRLRPARVSRRRRRHRARRGTTGRRRLARQARGVLRWRARSLSSDRSEAQSVRMAL